MTRQLGLSSLNLVDRSWHVCPAEPHLCEALGRELKISPVTAQLLCNRGVRSPEEADRYLHASLDQMRSPMLFRDMATAVTRIHQAILRREQVLIYGDYDVDGVTGVAVLAHFLRMTGLDPLTHIPDRLKEGYGFHAESVLAFHQRGVRLIITVDCGISAVEAVRLANECGVDVIITDHHECCSEIPSALAVLNPKNPGESFPFRDLAGVGVALYLVVALRAHLRAHGFWGASPEPNLSEYLDLVALGTLADMVPLRQENRIFVKHGIKVINRGSRPGLLTLKSQAGIGGNVLQTRPLIFRVIPRLNAPGRLGCAQDALDMLLCENLEEARRIVRVIEDRNTLRKSIEEKVFQEAIGMARQSLLEGERTALVLAAEGWHRGILGIVASRVAQETLRPVVLVSFEEEEGRGSIRSIQGLNVLEAVAACGDFLDGFGGHRMAAGISLKRENLVPFQDAFEKAVGALTLRDEQSHFGSTVLDLWLKEPPQLNETLAMELEQMEPFGYGNPEPVIGIQNARLLNATVVGDDHLRIALECESHEIEAIGFGMAKMDLGRNGSALDVAFTPQLDTWKGQGRLLLRIIDLKPAQKPHKLG